MPTIIYEGLYYKCTQLFMEVRNSIVQVGIHVRGMFKNIVWLHKLEQQPMSQLAGYTFLTKTKQMMKQFALGLKSCRN